MANTTNFNWETPDDTDLVKDGALAIRTLGSAIDTSLVDLKGGTTGQVLSKTSNTDMDFTWVAQDDADAIQKSLIDAEGDLIVGDAADAVQRLAIGSNGNVLTVDTSVDGKIKWAAPAAGGGKVLQVVFAETSTEAVNTTSTFADTGTTATITPSSATSKILVMVTHNGVAKDTNNTAVRIRLMRGATTIQQFAGNAYGAANRIDGTAATVYLDSPNTTSATTYKTQFMSTTNQANAKINVTDPNDKSSIILMEIGA
ncbi:MAG: hypothetical protein ACO3E4_07405 [Candidatus Nanopelagicaceae bacterium]